MDRPRIDEGSTQGTAVKKPIKRRLEKLENAKDPDKFVIVWVDIETGMVEVDGVTMTREEYERKRDPNTRTIRLDWD